MEIQESRGRLRLAALLAVAALALPGGLLITNAVADDGGGGSATTEQSAPDGSGFAPTQEQERPDGRDCPEERERGGDEGAGTTAL